MISQVHLTHQFLRFGQIVAKRRPKCSRHLESSTLREPWWTCRSVRDTSLWKWSVASVVHLDCQELDWTAIRSSVTQKHLPGKRAKFLEKKLPARVGLTEHPSNFHDCLLIRKQQRVSLRDVRSREILGPYLTSGSFWLALPAALYLSLRVHSQSRRRWPKMSPVWCEFRSSDTLSCLWVFFVKWSVIHVWTEGAKPTSSSKATSSQSNENGSNQLAKRSGIHRLNAVLLAMCLVMRVQSRPRKGNTYEEKRTVSEDFMKPTSTLTISCFVVLH